MRSFSSLIFLMLLVLGYVKFFQFRDTSSATAPVLSPTIAMVNTMALSNDGRTSTAMASTIPAVQKISVPMHPATDYSLDY